MSRHHANGRGAARRRGPIGRVTRGLADVFGIPRGVVIAGFVLGFIFIPLFTVVAFFVALYWVDHPERVRRTMDTANDSLRRAADRLRRGAASRRRRSDGGEHGHGSREPPRPPIDPAAVLRRFDRLERRTRAVEAFVASEEFRLHGEFRRMGGE